MIGKPEATPEEFLRVLRLTGLDHVAARHPKGINLPIGEMGEGLSGGQRQLVSLARSLLARPSLLLLDEPTSAMDGQTETQFLEHLKRATEGQTLVVVTHRPSLLALVDRIIIVDDGKVTADGPKDKILEALSGKPAKDMDKAAATATAKPRTNVKIGPARPVPAAVTATPGAISESDASAQSANPPEQSAVTKQ
ncbi:Iron import ATP-binding/permease protein IrtB [compost metagenome]